MNLTSASTVKQLLEQHGLYADKRFGQNFLVDASALSRIVQAVEIKAGEQVWEVGPGLGTLTRALALEGAQVNTIEMDKRLEAVHATTLEGLGVQVHWQDALTFDWSSVPMGSKFAGNLPYNIATPLVTQLLKSGRFERIVVLVQKEVAERMVAQPSTAAYGVLSLRIAHHSQAKKLFDVPAGSFLPAPKITSSVVRMMPNTTPDHPALFKLIEAAFAQRRKTLANCLKSAGYSFDASLLENLGWSSTIRGEALSLEQFGMLHQALTVR